MAPRKGGNDPVEEDEAEITDCESGNIIENDDFYSSHYCSDSDFVLGTEKVQMDDEQEWETGSSINTAKNHAAESKKLIDKNDAPKSKMPKSDLERLNESETWGRGIINDFRRTVGTHWVEEFTNFNQKTVAVTLLIFISVIAPTLTFGAVYGKETRNQIGALETLVATSWVGLVYSLIGGMPMCIIGSTGTVVAFTKAVVRMADNLDVPYLTFNAWISAWVLCYCLTAAIFDLTRVVRAATRFTDEIFAFLVVTIFVFDAVGDPFSDVGILRYFDPNNKAHEDHKDDDGNFIEGYNYMEVALLSFILGFGTTALIFFFRSFKESSFSCGKGVRNAIYDFAITVSVVIGTVIKEFVFPDIQTEQLNVPYRFEPTFHCCDNSCRTFFPDDCPHQEQAFRSRSWFVDFSDLNGKGWVPLVAAGPAILAFLLCFLDNGITWHLINHRSHNLKHGVAYNYDLCLNGFFNFVNGCFGLPWLVATTVPCIIHLNSLANKDKDGKIMDVQETRLTMFISHLMVGLSLLVLELLHLLPVPVLYGVFLFMGLSALPAMQFWNRFLLWFKEPSLYPDAIFNRFMEKNKVHFYTTLQIFFFGLVFLVQNLSVISIAFPLMTLLCIPARLFFLPRFFDDWELLLLDGDDLDIEEWADKEYRVMHSLRLARFEETQRQDSSDESRSRLRIPRCNVFQSDNYDEHVPILFVQRGDACEQAGQHLGTDASLNRDSIDVSHDTESPSSR